MKSEFRAKLKRLYYHLRCGLRRHLLARPYKFEYEFFEKIRSETYSDSSFIEMKLRKTAHGLDKQAVFEKFRKKEAIYGLAAETLAQVQKDPEHDAATVRWAQAVLDNYRKRLNGEPPLSGEFGHFDLGPKDGPASELLREIVESRRSIRSFEPRPINKDVFHQILRAGLWAPTGCNRQPVEYLLLEDKEDIRFCQRMAGEGYPFPAEAPLNVVVLMDPRGYALPAQRHMAFLEAGAAAQNILLTAYSLGVGSCWLFWADHGGNYPKFIKRFSLKPWLLPAAMICLGYPDKVPKFCPARKDLSKCLHYPKPPLPLF